MGTCFLYGNGGGTSSSLNFFIKRYQTSDNLLADTPKENTIGIVTDAVLGTVMFRSNEASGSENNVLITCDTTNAVSDTSLMAWNTKVSGLSTNIALALTSCTQYLSGTWIPKTACIFMSGAWVQFSEAFLATISVTYPSGSTCTASCGNLEYEAPDATGSWTFTAPVSGTWTISITNGTNTSSRNVSITTSGQSESVSISYIYYIINASGTADYTGGWTSSGNTGTGRNGPPPGEVEGGVSCVCSAWGDYTPAGEGVVTTNDYIDLTGFTKLTASVGSFVNADYQNEGTICIIDSSGSTVTSVTVAKTATTVTIDFSGLGNSYKIAIKSGRGKGKDGGGDKVGYIVSMMSLE